MILILEQVLIAARNSRSCYNMCELMVNKRFLPNLTQFAWFGLIITEIDY